MRRDVAFKCFFPTGTFSELMLIEVWDQKACEVDGIRRSFLSVFLGCACCDNFVG